MAATFGPYTSAVRAGDFLFVSGQLGVVDGELANDTVAQARAGIINLDVLLAEHGATLDQVVKTTVFLADMADFDAMNEVYVELIPEPRPARSCVAVKTLPKNARFEIEAVVFLG